VIISDAQVAHFRRCGFFLLPNPHGQQAMREVDRRQRDRATQWQQTQWPEGFNRLACQFLMLGETALQLVEKPELVEAACHLLECDRVHVGACGLGDASSAISEDGRPWRQVHWHADGGPEVRQVSLRTALDRHDAGNAPLRVLPGTHLRPKAEVAQELMEIELASGQHQDIPGLCFARHPSEVEVVLDPRWTLVWTPSCWHATGVKTTADSRRAMSWNYYPAGGRTRDLEALKHIFAHTWEAWPDSRKQLWGLAS